MMNRYTIKEWGLASDKYKNVAVNITNNEAFTFAKHTPNNYYIRLSVTDRTPYWPDASKKLDRVSEFKMVNEQTFIAYLAFINNPSYALQRLVQREMLS